MDQLSKEKKHEAYKRCFNDIRDYKYEGCCFSFAGMGYYEAVNNAKELFPELYNLRTINNSDYWFETRMERLLALRRCIELTK